MQFAPTAEQDNLRSSVRSFLQDRCPEPTMRRIADGVHSHDHDLWQQMAVGLGLHGLAVPEVYGGAGGSAQDLGVVLEEMGRALLPGPFFSTVALAGNLLLLSQDTEAAERWLPALAAGELIASVALIEPGGSWNPADTATRAVPAAGGWRLHGQKSYVTDAALADLLLVPARTDLGVSLFAVESSQAAQAHPLEALDPTRPVARVELSGAPAVLVGKEGVGVDLMLRLLDAAAVLLAAELLGVAARALELTTAQVKVREQFGRPLGSFQSVKHSLARVLLEVEAGRGAVGYALQALARQAPDLPVVAGIAKAHCSETAFLAASVCVQLHGGLGFTWEHPAHLYLKRATAGRLWLGDPAHYREQVARRAGLSPRAIPAPQTHGTPGRSPATQ